LESEKEPHGRNEPSRSASTRSILSAASTEGRSNYYNLDGRMASMDDLIERRFPFIAALPARLRDALRVQSVRKTLETRQMLVTGGSECAYLPFVLEGVLRIYKVSETGKEVTLYRIEQGESCILSATCILNGGSFPATAEAEGKTQILLLPAPLLNRLVEEDAACRRFIFDQYARRLDAVLTLVEEVTFHHMDMRIASYLLRNAGESGVLTSIVGVCPLYLLFGISSKKKSAA
jgi:CRP/FNR family transcriptional regulator, anaerobic regulatory protein